MNVNGWTLKIYPAFGEKYKKLIIQVEELKEKDPEEYQEHPATKFLKNITELIFNAPFLNHSIGCSSSTLSGFTHTISLSSSIFTDASLKNFLAVLSSNDITILSVASAASIKHKSFVISAILLLPTLAAILSISVHKLSFINISR